MAEEGGRHRRDRGSRDSGGSGPSLPLPLSSEYSAILPGSSDFGADLTRLGQGSLDAGTLR